MKRWIWISIIVVVVLVGALLITLWQTGVLTPKPSVPAVTTTPTPTPGSTTDPYQVDLKDFTDLGVERTEGHIVSSMAHNLQGTTLLRVVTDTTNEDPVAGSYSVSTATRVDRGWEAKAADTTVNYFTYCAAFDVTGTRSAYVTQERKQTSEAAFQMRFRMDGESTDAVIAIDDRKFLPTVLTDTVFYDGENVVMGYLWDPESNPTYFISTYELNGGAWEATPLSLVPTNATVVSSLSRFALLSKQSSGIVPLRRTSGTAEWTAATVLAGTTTAFASALTNFGNCAIVLTSGRIPVMFAWQNNAYVSMGTGSALSYGAGAASNASFVMASCPFTPFFAILYAGDDSENASLHLYRTPSDDFGGVEFAADATESTFATPVKSWNFDSKFFGLPILKMNWSSTYGLDLDGALVEVGGTTSTVFHVNALN